MSRFFGAKGRRDRTLSVFQLPDHGVVQGLVAGAYRRYRRRLAEVGMPHSFPGFERLRRFARSYYRKGTVPRDDARLTPAQIQFTRVKRVLVVGTRDVASTVALSGRLRSCGFPVILAVEALDIRDSLNLNPDLVVVQVHQGRELRAYYAGRVTAERGISTLFVAPNLQTLAIQALQGALPICILLDYFCSNVELTAAVNEFQDNAVQ